MRLHRLPHDFGRTLILLGCAALHGIQHVHLPFAGMHRRNSRRRDRARDDPEPLPPRRGGGAQVRTSFENRTAQAICRRAANRGRWTVTGPGSGSVCLFSVALSRRRSTTNLLDSQAAATILQAKSSRPLGSRPRACARYGVLVVGEEMKGLVLSRCSAAVTGVELARIIWCPSVRRSRGPTRPHETSHSPGNQLLLGKSNHGASLRSATGQNWRG